MSCRFCSFDVWTLKGKHLSGTVLVPFKCRKVPVELKLKVPAELKLMVPVELKLMVPAELKLKAPAELKMSRV